MPNVIQLLRERGLIEICTPELETACQRTLKVYCGFDPTADSLHLGNLQGIIVLAWFLRCGHQPVALVGGATGMIGDPGGKVTERPLLAIEDLQRNTTAIHRQLEHLLNRATGQAESLPIYNNYTWYEGQNVLSFLRDIGRHFRLGPMLAKETVRARLQSAEGLSFTEFSYQLLQGYDFLHLYRDAGVTLQIGGSDQWGNITAGIELIRKVTHESAEGLVFPLLTRSDGQKFGKSEKGAIWLSAERLSPYEFYQHLYRVNDEDAITLLRRLTFVPLAEVDAYATQLKEGKCPPNTIQQRLAAEVTRFVHGEEGLAAALSTTNLLAPGKATKLDGATLNALGATLPHVSLSREKFVGAGIINCLVSCGLISSKGEARKLILNGGLYLNNEKITDVNYVLTAEDLIDEHLCVVAVGRKNKVILRLE